MYQGAYTTESVVSILISESDGYVDESKNIATNAVNYISSQTQSFLSEAENLVSDYLRNEMLAIVDHIGAIGLEASRSLNGKDEMIDYIKNYLEDGFNIALNTLNQTALQMEELYNQTGLQP